MFNFKDIKEVNPIAPGKRKEECALTAVTRDKNDDSMLFTFVEKATQATLVHREFAPKRGEQQSDEDYKKSVGLSVSRLAHIYRAFATQEQFEAVRVEGDQNNAANFKTNWVAVTKQMGKGLVDMIAAGKDMTCALKVVLRAVKKDGKTNYYSSLPQVPPFISTASHPKEFTVNPTYDLFEAPSITPDREAPAGQGAANGAASGQSAPQSTFAGQADSGGDF